MPTSSITKTFYVKDYEAFKRLVEDLEKEDYTKCEKMYTSPALEKGREKLKTFQFKD